MARGYRSSGWSDLSLRFVGSLVVFAIAALSGAVIGGVGVYIINDAINAPPAVQGSADGSASSGPKQAKAQDNKSPVAVVQPQPPPKPAAAPATPQARPQNESHAATQDVSREDAAKQSAARQDAATQAAGQQAVQKPLPEAGAPAADSAPHGAAATQAEAKSSDDADTKAGPAHAATDNQADVARKKAAAIAKRRSTVTGMRRFTPETSEQAQSGAQRAYYDYYDRDDPRAGRGFSPTRQRIIVRRQDNDGWNYQNQGAVFPAQPRQSFFGLFGRDRYNDRGDHW